MAKSSRSKIPGANLPVPQTHEAAARAIAEIGVMQRAVARIEHDMNDVIALAKKRAEAQALGATESIKCLTEGLRIWCEAHRARLTGDSKVKFYQFGTGKIEWRLRPPAVRLKPGTKAEDLIEWLEAHRNYVPFVRIKKEINKEAMLAAPDLAATVPGISISSAGEDFSVTPFEAQIEGGK